MHRETITGAETALQFIVFTEKAISSNIQLFIFIVYSFQTIVFSIRYCSVFIGIYFIQYASLMCSYPSFKRNWNDLLAVIDPSSGASNNWFNGGSNSFKSASMKKHWSTSLKNSRFCSVSCGALILYESQLLRNTALHQILWLTSAGSSVNGTNASAFWKSYSFASSCSTATSSCNRIKRWQTK